MPGFWRDAGQDPDEGLLVEWATIGQPDTALMSGGRRRLALWRPLPVGRVRTAFGTAARLAPILRFCVPTLQQDAPTPLANALRNVFSAGIRGFGCRRRCHG